MMRIDSLAAAPDRLGRHRVTFSNGETMKLYRQTVEDFGLFPGLELTDERFAALKEHAGAVSAKMRAVRIVAASNVSKGDLKNRLIHKGEDPRQAAQAVAWMEELKLVDDRETARQIAARCAAKGYGPARVKQALYEKRIPKACWEEVLADYPDQTDYILKFLRSKIKDFEDRDQVRKAIGALMRRGHSYNQVRSALNRLGGDSGGFPEDL